MKKFIALLLAGIILSSCATTTVNIGTNADGATVIVDGRIRGQSPINPIKLKNSSGKQYEVIIEKEGYKTFQGNLKKEDNMPAVIAVVVGYSFCWLLLPALLLINAQYMEKPVEDQYFLLEKAN